MPKSHLIITLDGPAGAGKSTVAKSLAKRLGISYLDTGAMYRAITLKALKNKLNMEDEKALAAMARQSKIDFIKKRDGSLNITLDGKDVSKAIRSVKVTNHTFYTARAASVRAILVAQQKAFGRKQSLVSDGRDQGTVVFPKASYKFYVDADVEERVLRRMKDLKQAGKKVNINDLRRDMQERDHKDFTRKTGPLKKTTDMITIDSTGLKVEQTVDKIMSYIMRT